MRWQITSAAVLRVVEIGCLYRHRPRRIFSVIGKVIADMFIDGADSSRRGCMSKRIAVHTRPSTSTRDPERVRSLGKRLELPKLDTNYTTIVYLLMLYNELRNT